MPAGYPPHIFDFNIICNTAGSNLPLFCNKFGQKKIASCCPQYFQSREPARKITVYKQTLQIILVFIRLSPYESRQPLGKDGRTYPLDVFEEKYAELFPSLTGNVAKPRQMALGAPSSRQGSSIQTMSLSDRSQRTRTCSTSSAFTATRRRRCLTQVPC